MSRRLVPALAALAAALVGTACGSDSEPIASGPDVTFNVPTTALPTAAGPATGDVTTVPGSAGAPSTASTTAAPTAPASTVPLGDPVIALTPIAEAESPVDLAWRAGDTTLFVVEQDGFVRPLRDGQLGAPVLDVTDLTDGGGEQGLLGLTFGADGTRAYVNYTDDDSGATHVDEFAVAADGTFDLASRRELLVIDQPYANHNGGNVTIGPDGMLYVGMGDGGSGGDPERRALNVSTLLGKILRIDPAASDVGPYGIPADNPFVGVEGARPEIWSVGLRNPWRFSFDRATGDLWIADVGQGEWEEIDVAWADEGAGRGINFGWSAFEGTHRFNEDQPPDGATPPIHEYQHGDETGCSVSGGAVYRGSAIPALVGWYVFGDYCSGVVSALRTDGKALAQTLVLASTSSVTAVREGPDGELYVLSIDGPIALVTPG